MRGRYLLTAVSLLATPLIIGAASAREMPPANAKPVSEIAQMIEQRQDFQAFESIEFDDGVYEVEYHTKDGAKKEVRIDPISGTEK